MAPSLAPQPAGKPCSAPAAPWSWLLIDSEDGFPDSYVTLQAIEDGEEATQKKTLKKKKKTHIYIYKDSVTGPSFPSLCKCGNTNKRPSGHFQLHPRFKSWVGGWVPLRGRSGKRSSLLRQRFGHRPFFSISLQVRDHEQKAIRPLPTPPITSHNFSHKG